MEALTYKTGVLELPYRLRGSGKDAGKVPLVVFLHGIGQRGSDNEAQLKHGIGFLLERIEESGTPCVVLAPQCPLRSMWAQWNIQTGDLPKHEKLSEPLAAVLELIEQLPDEHPIDPKRIYLTGLSMGGYGAWDLLWRRPELFAAAIPICGAGLVEEASAIADLPIWLFHGDQDEVIPVEQSRKMVEALKAAGGDPRYTEYEGVEHDSWSRTYADPEVLRWLFAQSR